MGMSNMPFLVFLCFSLNFFFSTGVDSISANQSLSGDQTLLSSGEHFRLGFYSPGNNSNHYICMWYNQVSVRTIVWVANRDSPVSDPSSSQLTIQNGNLVLLNRSQNIVWSTGLNSTTSNSLVAVLLDDGNLVLRDGPSNSSTPLWGSFDNPTHTWLPGSRIAYNNRTRTKQLLTSWKNSEDPGTGHFSLELDPNGSQYIIRWNHSEQYWTSGAWNGEIFSSVPEMRLNYIYNFSYVTNVNESYFTYSLYNPSIISRFVMDISGQIKQFTWLENSGQWNLFWSQPRQQCEVYSYCGAFGICNENSQTFCTCVQGFSARSESDRRLSDYSGGCVRNTDLQCGSTRVANGERDRFLTNTQMGLHQSPQPVAVSSIDECQTNCLNNCNCTAYAYDYDSSGCTTWNGKLLNLQQLPIGDGSGRTIYIRLAASEISGGKNNKLIIVCSVVGSVVAILLSGLVIVLMRRRQRRLMRSTKPVEGSLVAFGYKEMQHATKNFSDKLGGGGFGSVFKGTLSDLTVIAVKKLESISQGEKQFRTEVSTIGAIQHVNLVRLHGFCSEGNNKLLVYEYMPNGSLDSHLFSMKESKVLDWKTRYQIALGTARGLTYLHEKCRDCIIHCDIKPENILLDTEFCPKVADFGLAKLVGREFSRVLTTMRGTRGYLAPEWISGVPITPKADVYSYGMMLFEFISGRRNSEHSEDGKVKFFPTWATGVIVEGGDVLGILDSRLERAADAEEVTRICRIACWCIQDDENHRPSMGHVVQILEGIIDVNMPPVPKSLQLFVDNEEHIVFFTDSSSQSSHALGNQSNASSQSKNSTSSSNSKSETTSRG